MFSRSSYVVIVWVKAVKNGTYSKEQVPKLSNLQEVVYSILEKSAEHNSVGSI